MGAAPGLNGDAAGETWLRVATNGDDIVRIGIADLRGDGRPDYAYNGWVLYADTVSPTRLPASGGPITIQGMGFRLADTVTVGGQAAIVTSISPNQITAVVPPAPAGVTGSVDVEVDDQPALYAAAVIPGGVSYDSGNGDALTLNTAPAEYRAHRRAASLLRHGAGLESCARRRRHRHLHRDQRRGHARLAGCPCARWWPRATGAPP